MKSRLSNHHDGEVLPSKGETTICELCHRQVNRYTVHHLVPRAKGGRFGPTARLCPTCHRQLHAMFSEATLAQTLYSIDLLRANPQVSSYLRWVRKQKSSASFPVRRANHRG
jgi:5-methylcytosine-specific restriction protein A